MRVLLVEPYFAGSHRVWAEGYQVHSGNQVTLLTLPGRWWTWRMRGGAVTLADRASELEPYDVVLVSDMIDLPLFRARLGWDVPYVLYFHESQLTYPVSSRMRSDRHYSFTNWVSALTADRVWFNTAFHRDIFFEKMAPFLRGFPDETHEGLIPDVAANSEVLPVGIDLSWIEPGSTDRGADPPLLLWNHRWEEDKDPDAFFRICDALAEDGVEFRLAVCGESSVRAVERYAEVRQRHRDRIVHFGYADLDRYRHLLRSADVVTSTARQEFFGIAVVEAIAAGATPVLPNRLSYPSIIPTEYHDAVLTDDLVDGLTKALAATDAGDRQPPGLREAMMRYDWSTVAPQYDRELHQVVSRARSRR